MKIKVLIIFTLLSFNCFAQEKIELRNIYFENRIAFNELTNQVFTGIAQNKNKKGYIKSEEVYENGILLKKLLYYNIHFKQIVSDETIFNPKTNKKITHLRYSSDGKIYWETIFDENQRKSEFNTYENGINTLHEEYLNGKKHGKWFKICDDGTECKKEYSNGKKIKDCN